MLFGIHTSIQVHEQSPSHLLHPCEAMVAIIWHVLPGSHNPQI